MSSTVSLLDIFKYILGSISGLIAIAVTLLLIVELSITQCRQVASTRNCFYVLIILHGIVRCAFNFTPIAVFKILYRTGGWGLAVQNVLDLLPELFFFLQYMMILFSWMEVYHMSRALKLINRRGRKRLVSKPLIGILVTAVVTAAVVLFMSLLILVIPGITYENVPKGQVVMILILTLIGTTLIGTYFILLYRQYRKLSSFNDSLVKRTQLKCSILAAVYCFFLLVRVPYIAGLNGVARDLIDDGYFSEPIFSTIWFIYFIVTEQLPILLVLFITRTFATAESFEKLLRRRDSEGSRERRLGRMQRKMLIDEDEHGNHDGSGILVDDFEPQIGQSVVLIDDYWSHAHRQDIHEGYWSLDESGVEDSGVVNAGNNSSSGRERNVEGETEYSYDGMKMSAEHQEAHGFVANQTIASQNVDHNQEIESSC